MASALERRNSAPPEPPSRYMFCLSARQLLEPLGTWGWDYLLDPPQKKKRGGRGIGAASPCLDNTWW